MKIVVAGFENGEEIPVRFSCDGADRSPAIEWSDLPEGTDSLALIMDDPDAPMGTFTHWIIYSIGLNHGGLDASLPSDGKLESGARQGKNDFGNIGYGGPCPPRGRSHRYYFRLFALKPAGRIEAGISRKEFDGEIGGRIIEVVSYMGNYKRK
ncbi:hypothetical protein IX51_04860 [uncultured archaeon]|nr:hypothetical protein IX51_04860 [uncultured archaeon]HKJ96653.1 YbhB/YbcL family Raf kinase inhibitor-like protein [Thermoplasmataceae archaeon]